MRAIAVLAVLGSHAFPAWVKGGFVGVDAFFSLPDRDACFLANLRRGQFSYVCFYARRINRLFPALLLILAVSLVGGRRRLLLQLPAAAGGELVGHRGPVEASRLGRNTRD